MGTLRQCSKMQNYVKLGEPELIIFDKDGTLLDDGRTWGPVVERIAEKLESGPSAQEVQRFFGYDPRKQEFTHDSLFMTAAPSKQREVLDALAQQSENGNPFAGRFSTDQVLDLCYNIPVGEIPWSAMCPLKDLFQQLPCKIAIATNDTRKYALDFITSQGVENQIGDMVCGDDEIEPKPSPAPILAILHRMGVSSDKAVMVGDSRHDMRSGLEANLSHRVGVLSGVCDENHLLDAGATMILPDITHLLL